MKVKWRSKTVVFDPPPVKSFGKAECLHFMQVGLETLYAKEAKRVISKGASAAETVEHLALYRPVAPDPLAKLKRKAWMDLTEAERELVKNGS